MPFRILVVEDDPSAAEFVVKGLRQDGYTVESVTTGPDALHMATSEHFDAIILDRNLPGLDGLSVLRALRGAQKSTPIIILSALAHADERVNGLKAGADDYLGKPFSFSELQIRLDNLLRRHGAKAAETVLTCGDLSMDLLTRRVTRDGKVIDLLQREFQILEQLLRHKDRIITRTALLEQVWDYRFDPHTSLIDTHMSRLRKKLEDGFNKPLLHTVRGVGYRLSEAS
ncbi:MAG TPA: response regulator transcription factor [Hyphomonadaceae bacterium]|nr:response regulator transcription factor [Hyphomonadaceae bacterium]HPN04654.1 response regulator transcription factor [Hyphomonadaceae bacterium]